MQEKKVYYMAIARNQITLADFAKSHKFKYQQSTNEIISKIGAGDGIIPFNEMEYAVKNETATDGLMYLMLVEKGYYQPKAFRCLQRMKDDFNKFFDPHQVANARYLSLNKEFEGAFDRIYVELDDLRKSTAKRHSTRRTWPSRVLVTSRRTWPA